MKRTWKWIGIIGLIERIVGLASDASSLDPERRRPSWGTTAFIIMQIPAWLLLCGVVTVLSGVGVGLVDVKALAAVHNLIGWPVASIALGLAATGLICHLWRKKSDRQALREVVEMIAIARGNTALTSNLEAKALELVSKISGTATSTTTTISPSGTAASPPSNPPTPPEPADTPQSSSSQTTPVLGSVSPPTPSTIPPQSPVAPADSPQPTPAPATQKRVRKPRVPAPVTQPNDQPSGGVPA